MSRNGTAIALATVGAFVFACLLQLLYTYFAMIFLMWAHDQDARVPNLGFMATFFVGAALRMLISAPNSSSKD